MQEGVNLFDILLLVALAAFVLEMGDRLRRDPPKHSILRLCLTIVSKDF